MKSKVIFAWQFTAAVSALFIVGALCGQDVTQPDNPFFRKNMSASPSPTAGAKAATKTISPKDKSFLTNAVSSGSWEMANGREAEQKAESSATKEVAARMIADHSEMNKELIDLAKKKGLAISAEGGKAQHISADGFDNRYLSLVVQDHQEESRVFEKQAKSGDDADIRNWAAKNLPRVKQHLSLAKEAMSKAK